MGYSPDRRLRIFLCQLDVDEGHYSANPDLVDHMPSGLSGQILERFSEGRPRDTVCHGSLSCVHTTAHPHWSYSASLVVTKRNDEGFVIVVFSKNRILMN
jgi:hypothetical protein